MIVLFAAALLMAEPTHVYQVTFTSSMNEAEVKLALASFHVLQVKRLGNATKQSKWDCVIQSKDVKTRVRDNLKKLKEIQRVKVLE